MFISVGSHRCPRHPLGALGEKERRKRHRSILRIFQFSTLISYCVLDSARSVGYNVKQSSKVPQVSTQLPPGMAIEFCLGSIKEKVKAEISQRRSQSIWRPRLLPSTVAMSLLLLALSHCQ